MKKLLFIALLSLSTTIFAQTYDVSTLRIGEFKIFMSKQSAEQIGTKTLDLNVDYEKGNKVNYYGENIDILLSEQYQGENKPNKIGVYLLRTKSRKFRTKSGLGVGSSRPELIEAYKSYPNFEVYQYKDPENPTKVESFFTLKDLDAGTFLSFKMMNDMVIEITVGVEEGC